MTVMDESVEVRYLPEKDTSLITNKIALEQIFINLISNAIKYSDKDHTKIDIQLIKHKEEYELTVRDNGSGIAPENINSVFKLFYVAAKQDRNGKQGTGIGLATVARLLEHMDGRITVDSQLGEWTEFKIHLPKKVKTTSAIN
jgi:signal transduction histidine kinase